jgi:peptidylprolyl isomerase
MPPMQRFFLIIFACLALFVAGCGDDSSTTAGVGETTSAQEKAEAIEAEEAEAKKAAEEEAEKVAAEQPKVTVPSGPPPKKLVTKDLKQGSGAAAKAGDEVTVHYVGVGYDTKKEFDASWSRGEPFTFSLGSGGVISGWEQGIDGMKAGGRRELIIPPELAYGPAGSPPAIGPNETLIFVVDLLSVK